MNIIRPKTKLPGLVITGFFLITAISACGFQMRGNQSINVVNLPSLNLRSSAAEELSREVRSQLQMAGVDISSGAAVTLSLTNEFYRRTVLSVSPRTGKVEEYQLTLTASMSLSKAGSNHLVENEPISVSSDFLFDENALLAKSSEEDQLKDTLRRQAATMIIRRMNAATRNE